MELESGTGTEDDEAGAVEELGVDEATLEEVAGDELWVSILAVEDPIVTVPLLTRVVVM